MHRYRIDGKSVSAAEPHSGTIAIIRILRRSSEWPKARWSWNAHPSTRGRRHERAPIWRTLTPVWCIH